MNKNEKSAATAEELVTLTKDASVQRIVVHGNLINVPSVRLAPGQFLRGEHEHSSITFAPEADGLQLSSDNRIHNIRLQASPDKRAIFNDTSVASLGRIELRGVTTIGYVQILARDKGRNADGRRQCKIDSWRAVESRAFTCYSVTMARHFAFAESSSLSFALGAR